jgi:hypothetical protein
MSRFIFASLLAALFGFSGKAEAVIGTLDDVPAATLLLPYFEVDPGNPNGVTTLLTIRNADSHPVVAHVTFWSNFSVPVLDFDIYLAGFDQQSLNLRDVFISGILPTTGPSDALSPRGDRSGPHETFGGSCGTTIGTAPAYSNPAISALGRTHVRAWLTGIASPLFGTCAGGSSEHMVGYVTIDAVNRCNLLFPSSPGYFAAGGQGIASNRNVLWGDWTLIDPSSNTVQSDTLVHIEASATDPLTSTPGIGTFYGRYTGGTAADNREALPAVWYAPLDPLAGVGDSAELVVWRDSGQAVSEFPCNHPPAVFPLSAQEISAVSPEGTATPLAASLFPWETQRVPIAQAASWLRLNFAAGNAFQSHATVLRRSPGLAPPASILSTGTGAVQERESGMIGTADAAPGATLLLPYFEADPGSPTGVQTALAVRNSLSAPVLARVVLWTDLGVPTFGFEIYLPGSGSRVIDLKDVFLTGTLPASGPSPLPGCGGVLPPPPIPAVTLAALNTAHTGGASQLFGGLCAGANHGDGVARGYVTVDVVTRCSFLLPSQPGYFEPGGVAVISNVIWGDYALVEPANNRAHGDTLIHLQASDVHPLTSAPGQPTFYGRYVSWSAADHREALVRGWGAGSRRDGAQPGSASLLVWRDSGQISQPFACGSPPPSLSQGISLHFDETGQDVPVPPLAFGLAAQKRPVDWTGPDIGALSLELGGGFAPPFPQAYVTGLEGSLDGFSLGSIPGAQIPTVTVFKDGFESGGLEAWLIIVP